MHFLVKSFFQSINQANQANQVNQVNQTLTVVIERCSQLRDALLNTQKVRLFYHSLCLSKRLRFQLKAIATKYQFSPET